LRALQLRIAEANADMELQRRKGYPDIAPAFGYTRQYQEAAMAMPDANSWSASVTMSMPIYNRNQGNQAKASAKASQSRFEFRAGQVDLMAEVQTVVQELDTARANADAIAKEQLQIARQVRDSINTAYSIGGRPLLDVLDAQRNFSQTYSLYVMSRANYWRAVYKYNSVLGQQILQP
jgi:cobalt-zinc-cadmium efflux system outer membrane protein